MKDIGLTRVRKANDFFSRNSYWWLLEYVYNDILWLDKVGYWMLIIRISYSRTRPSASEYVCNPHTPMPHHQRMVNFMIHETYLYGQVSNIAGPITMGKDGRQTNPSRAL